MHSPAHAQAGTPACGAPPTSSAGLAAWVAAGLPVLRS